MRLLNSSNLQLKYFASNRIPPYAILSHTWGEDEDEVLFADVERGSAKGKPGYEKIRYSCEQAAAHNLEYVWIDTCCIDKSSSAELSEAINSMYSWYKRASICYAYLADVPANVDTEALNSPFSKSRWFKRGWTLQELIGPSKLIFFSDKWTKIGTKSTLHDILAKITGVDVGVLTGVMDLESTSLAKRMSWASHRATTRIEDIAYCLMGLFDVNMPLLYGEGEKAFIRLQEEIMKHSDDQSLFTWTDPGAAAGSYHGLLAKSPVQFVNSSKIVPYRDWEPSAPFSISNKGLRIELHLSPYEKDLYVAALECPAPPDYEGFLGIYLTRISTESHQYARVKPQALCKIAVRGSLETVYVRQYVLTPGPQDLYPLHAFQLRKGPTRDDGYELIRIVSSSPKHMPAPLLSSHTQQWVKRWQSTFKISKENGRLAGALLFERIDGERLIVLLGSTTDFGIGFEVASASDIENYVELKESFNPQPPGNVMALKNHQVRVNAEPRVHAGVKYYMVDIVIEAIYHARNPIGLIKEIMPGQQSQSDQRPPNTTVNPSRGFGRFKHLLSLDNLRPSQGPG